MFRSFLKFKPILYPLWRRQVPPMLQPFREPVFERFYPIHADDHAPETYNEMADFLVKWDLIPQMSVELLARELEACSAQIETAATDIEPTFYEGDPLHLPAQWDKNERVLMSWGRMYPPVWAMHAQMAAAISHVAVVELLLPTEMWARAVAVYLEWHGYANMKNLRFLVLRTDDIWVRDYGPIMGLDPDGKKVAVNAIYDVLPQYPQADDDKMPYRWATHHGYPVRPLDLHTEGGNLWSDGQGTLLMSAQVFFSNRYRNRDNLLEYVHSIFDLKKIIITPRLTLEETGHIDLLAKLANPTTMLVSAPTSFTTGEALRKNKRLFERETNANGDKYQVIELPTPSLYLNWFSYTIRRSYTNSLTVNGRVLVPTFAIPEDEIALRIYEEAMPDHDIIPIDSSLGINGGGAVHCMTKEVPI